MEPERSSITMTSSRKAYAQKVSIVDALTVADQRSSNSPTR